MQEGVFARRSFRAICVESRENFQYSVPQMLAYRHMFLADTISVGSRSRDGMYDHAIIDTSDPGHTMVRITF